MYDTLQAPCSCNPAISPHVEQALLKALAVQPEDRYYSMADFARALQQNTFTAYSDPTIAQPIPPPPPPPPAAHPANPTGTPSVPPVVPGKTNQNQWGNGYRPQQPTPARPASAPYSARGTVPPGYVLVPQTALVPPKPLPGAVSQGCLWGLLQGVLSALIVLFLKKEADFYLAIGIGFLFYLLAGFLTTRRGGSAMRGAIAGFWAGITGTIVFWITLLIGAIILVASRINADTLAARQQGDIPPPDEVQRAWRAILPIFSPHLVSRPSSSTQSAIVVFLVAGILLALAFGLLGGLLGRLLYRSRLRRKAKMVLKNA
jgi:hypothetical protein